MRCKKGMIVLLAAVFSIIACNKSQNSPHSEVRNIPPKAPENVLVKNITYNTVHLVWDSAVDSDGTILRYEVYLSKSPDKDYTLKMSSVSTSAVVIQLTSKTVYYFKIKAIDNNFAESEFSETASASTVNSSPISPSVINVTNVGTSSATLTWNGASDADGSVTAYAVYLEQPLLGIFIKVATVGTATYDLSGLSSNKNTMVRVTSIDDNGLESENYCSVTVKTLNQAPGVPSGLSVSTVSCNGVTIQWSAAIDFDGTVASYNVYYKKSGDASYSFGTNSSDLSGLVSGLSSKSIYSFIVRAVDNNGALSSDSVSVSAVTTNAPPQTPLNLKLTASTLISAQLEWDAAIDSDGSISSYNVYMSDDGISFTKIGTATTNSYTANSLNNDLAYVFRVTAVDNDGMESVESNEATKVMEWDYCKDFSTYYGFSQHVIVAFKNKLWAIAPSISNGSDNYLLSSSDGIEWQRHTVDVPWVNLSGFVPYVLGNKLFLAGGDDSSKIYSTTNGTTWVLERDAAEWPGRSGHCITVYNNTVYLTGGNYSSRWTRKDLWKSTDGINWTSVSTDAMFERVCGSIFGFNNMLYITGGIDTVPYPSTRKIDFISTPDCINFTKMNFPNSMIDDSWKVISGFSYQGEIIIRLEFSTGGVCLYSSTNGVDFIYQSSSENNPGCINEFNGKLYGKTDGTIYTSIDGLNWKYLFDPNQFGSRTGHKIINFNGSLFMYGGYAGGDFAESSIWSSSDGKLWNPSEKTILGVAGHSIIQFNNKLLSMGGFSGTNSYSLIRSSTDGLTWTNEGNLPLNVGRRSFGCVVFQNKIWILGGFDGNNRFADIWNSNDGITWNKITDEAPWGNRSLHGTFVYDNKIWLAGGGYGINGVDQSKTDIWNSEDGITWTKISDNCPWYGETTQFIINKNRIWAIGGSQYGRLTNQIWYSKDGKKWVLAGVTDLNKRVLHAADVFNGKIIITGGASNYSESGNSAVWSSK